MIVYSYSLPQVILTREQTQFFADVKDLIIDVQYALFGDLVPLDVFREYVKDIDSVFGIGAVEASKNLQASYGETTREALTLIESIRGMAAATNFGEFSDSQNSYESNYGDYVRTYVNMYNIDED
jgi:hypothetical protein